MRRVVRNCEGRTARLPFIVRPRSVALLALAGFPVELFPRKHGSSLEDGCPDAERARTGWVIDRVAYESFDARTLEHEHNALLCEKDAVSPKTGSASP